MACSSLNTEAVFTTVVWAALIGYLTYIVKTGQTRESAVWKVVKNATNLAALIAVLPQPIPGEELSFLEKVLAWIFIAPVELLYGS
mmetsp:Transcript_13363/g.20881  ORF Transcript_13363/g.20881 Transcript_13363/m.20881 type:complete len:86 (-) Transcript_13363:3834-4091(-)